MKPRSVVRVVLQAGLREDDRLLSTAFLEQLRYAGVITIHRSDDTGACFDLLCPHKLETETWARHNADRMRSFGYNAVVAPEWRPGNDRPNGSKRAVV